MAPCRCAILQVRFHDLPQSVPPIQPLCTENRARPFSDDLPQTQHSSVEPVGELIEGGVQEDPERGRRAGKPCKQETLQTNTRARRTPYKYCKGPLCKRGGGGGGGGGEGLAGEPLRAAPPAKV